MSVSFATLRHLSYGTLLAANCLTRTPECKRTLELGFEGLNKQKKNVAYKYRFETDSYRNGFSEVSVSSDETVLVFP